jgi:hypothetical protein
MASDFTPQHKSRRYGGWTAKPLEAICSSQQSDAGCDSGEQRAKPRKICTYRKWSSGHAQALHPHGHPQKNRQDSQLLPGPYFPWRRALSFDWTASAYSFKSHELPSQRAARCLPVQSPVRSKAKVMPRKTACS